MYSNAIGTKPIRAPKGENGTNIAAIIKAIEEA